jgi:beta-glucosidase
MGKHKISQIVSFAAMLTVFIVTAVSVTAQSPAVNEESTQRAQALLKQMTVEEKIGQLNLSSGVNLGGFVPPATDQMITQGKVGAILWLSNTKEINRLQRLAVEKSRLHIPLLFGLDVIHGYRTVFPIPLAMASSWDPSVEESAQAFSARETRAAGIRWTFTPMVDIARDARWGRIQEGAGEDPYLGSAMARAQVQGFQGRTLGPDSVVTCLKHFAGYGAAEGGRDYDSSYIPEVLLRNVYLKPFQAGVDAGTGSLMTAYMDLNDVPASGNHWLLTDVLRKEWGFKGFLTSDAMAIGSLETHGFATGPADSAYKAITAGAGMDMASQTMMKNLPKFVAEGKISQAQLDAAVLPILAVKYQIGLFDNPYVEEPRPDAPVSTPGGISLTRKVAERSVVLLKNENHALPLAKSLKKVAIIGYLADSGLDVTGGGTAEGMFRGGPKPHFVTVLEALKNRLGPDAQITFVPGPKLSRIIPSFIDQFMGTKPLPPPTPAEMSDWLSKTKAAASDADEVIAVLGELAGMSGEASSRATLELPGIQEQMLEVAVSAGKPVVLVLQNGRPLDIRWAADHVPAILEAWIPGAEGGNAVANVLFGDVNPGGKLPVSWPRSAGQEPLYYNHNLTHAPEGSPMYTSRYWDLPSTPLYPFGYGLSYTEFKFANLRLTKDHMKPGESTEVQVDVTNTGSVPGDAVAQVYIHQRAGSASRPVRQLEGFRRVSLNPGETQTLRFPLGKDELSFWSPQTKAWAVEPAAFDIWAGEDSTAKLTMQLVVAP